jgi:hypothetical protein
VRKGGVGLTLSSLGRRLSLSFSGEVFIESKASPNATSGGFGLDGVSSRLDAGEIWIESFSLSKEEYARYGLRSGSSGNRHIQFRSTTWMEVWLSGLRHWFAKSTYKKIVSWVRIPFPPVERAGEIT